MLCYQRKLEKEFVMNGGVHPENDSDSGLEDSCTDVEEDEVSKNPSALGAFPSSLLSNLNTNFIKNNVIILSSSLLK